MPRPRLLLVSSGAKPSRFPLASFLRALSARWDLTLAADVPLPQERQKEWASAGTAFLPSSPGDGAGFPDRVKSLFTVQPLEAVLFLDAPAMERHFQPLRHIAGADQTFLCLFPDLDGLRGLPRGAEGLKAKQRWAQLLKQCDGIWTTTPADKEWVLSRLDGGLAVEVLPRFRDRPDFLREWAEQRLRSAAEEVRRLSSYGGAEDLASLILLTHNDGQYLKNCLASVRKHTPGPHEIIVVDNHTTDGSDAFLEKETGIKLIRSPKNLFFSGGCNLGLKAARGRYRVLLNADTLVTPGWLERLIRRLKRDPTVGLAGPYTNAAAGPQRVPATYKSVKGLDAFAEQWAKRREGGRLEVPRLDGFCLATTREAQETVGLLDERFGPGGYEDHDWCLRFRQAGYRLLLVEDVFVHHHGGKGYAGRDHDALREKNRRLFVEKWCQRSLEFLDEVW